MTTRSSKIALTAALFAAWAAGAAAQSGPTPFAGFKHDASQPIEVAADSLEVRNNDRVAVFRGAVKVRQGVVRMQASELEVTYRGGPGGGDAGGAAAAAPGQGAIERLVAIGDVLISNGKESAKSTRADYDVASGVIVMTGDVVLLQGDNIVKADRLNIDLATGKAKLQGPSRVRVQLDPSRR